MRNVGERANQLLDHPSSVISFDWTIDSSNLTWSRPPRVDLAFSTRLLQPPPPQSTCPLKLPAHPFNQFIARSLDEKTGLTSSLTAMVGITVRGCYKHGQCTSPSVTGTASLTQRTNALGIPWTYMAFLSTDVRPHDGTPRRTGDL